MTPASKYYMIGIDVGTTHIKAVIFNEWGTEISKSVVGTPSMTDSKYGQVWDPEAMWTTVTDATRSALTALSQGVSLENRVRDSEIVGVAVASVGESGVPLDCQGQALYPIIPWFDTRTFQQAQWWAREIGRERTAQITGLSVKSIYSAQKILWLLQEVNGLSDAIDTWLPVSSLISFKLTGERSIDYSQASRTMLFDQANLTWSQDLLDIAGIPRRILPEPVPSGTFIGRVTEPASRATGIPAGVPVFAGGHDHVCGALSVGATESGTVLDSCGTAESLVAPCSDSSRMADVIKNGFSFGSHVARGMYYAMGGLYASGGAQDWFRHEFCGREASYGDLIDLAGRSGPGSGGVIFIPRLLGSGPPDRDQRATGAFTRILPHVTLADFARAVLEGLSFELKMAVDAIEAGLKKPVRNIIAIGGGARNDLWLAIKACVLRMPIEVPQVDEAVALGAALLAGIGSGVYEDTEDALAKARPVRRIVLPDESLSQVYIDAFHTYTAVSRALLEVDRCHVQEERSYGS
jgi:xylulokinase